MSEIKLDVKAVGNIIKIAMTNSDMCKSCEFSGQCFFAYSCLSNNYAHYLRRLNNGHSENQ